MADRWGWDHSVPLRNRDFTDLEVIYLIAAMKAFFAGALTGVPDGIRLDTYLAGMVHRAVDDVAEWLVVNEEVAIACFSEVANL
jgi:hypothetical protein